ncbi:DUF1707 domain-containing protein [Nocardioides sp.]|uniref:DUF1707 SHOCT-like domain-containing protein n=1 Tax=Nocardioides sp. TaxID=35761 RepID=UPI00262FEDE3|nr:DUF1707 domain-containing protein [Nocardioides sp.]MCW2737494.1 hypothetical protein [Nocardioides sp.]
MSTPDPRLRIADSDRERAMADLAMHYADGRLDHEEYDERLDAIWTARTRADLAVLFSDLPRPQTSQPARPAPRPRSRERARLPLLPVLALLIALSIITGAPVWLLIFPLMFLRGRHGGRCAPSRGHADYRRPDRSPGR